MIFTDRSRRLAQFSCPWERWWKYHAFGRGLQVKSNSVPLATGLFTHRALEIILNSIDRSSPGVPHDEVIRQAIAEACELYREQVKEGGFQGVEGQEEVDYIVDEQTALIEGLVWCWALHLLPLMLEDFELVLVEAEKERVLDCTCELSGVGEVSIHLDRGCEGVVLMTRPDVILRNKSTGNLCYVEFKTASYIDPASYENNIQFALGSAAAESSLGEPISEFYVHGLIKGARAKEYDPSTRDYTGPRRQRSPLCYAYVRPAQPPMMDQDIKVNNQWLGDDGKMHRCGKAYQKTPTWLIDFEDQDPSMSKVEHYVKNVMTVKDRSSQLRIIGPFSTPDFLLDRALDEIAADERRWKAVQDKVEALVNSGSSYTSTEVLLLLSQELPRSWNCRRYKDSICDIERICFERVGWQDPLGSGFYQLREANHPIEFGLRKRDEEEEEG